MPYSMVTAQQGYSSEMVGNHYWAIQVLRSNRGGVGVGWEYTIYGVYRSALIWSKVISVMGGGGVSGCQFSEKNMLHNT